MYLQIGRDLLPERFILQDRGEIFRLRELQVGVLSFLQVGHPGSPCFGNQFAYLVVGVSKAHFVIRVEGILAHQILQGFHRGNGVAVDQPCGTDIFVGRCFRRKEQNQANKYYYSHGNNRYPVDFFVYAVGHPVRPDTDLVFILQFPLHDGFAVDYRAVVLMKVLYVDDVPVQNDLCMPPGNLLVFQRYVIFLLTLLDYLAANLGFFLP